MTESFITLLEKQDEEKFLSFLKSLTDGQKKQLIPEINKLWEEYYEFALLNGQDNSYGRKGTDLQRDLLLLSAFVCFNATAYNKIPQAIAIRILGRKMLSNIIDWYCPSWFDRFVSQQASIESLPKYISYKWLMEMSVKGILQINKALLVNVMPHMIFEVGLGPEQCNKTRWLIKFENLLMEKITLEEHIWYLFEMESRINDIVIVKLFEEVAEPSIMGWKDVFKKLMTDSHLDRFRLLRESLLAGNRNFNMILSGWFAQLFIELGPTTEEALHLQKELFSILSSPHGKVVDMSLKFIKSLLEEKTFDTQAFLDTIPVLLSSNKKVTVLSVLTMIEKLAQDHVSCQKRIVSIISQTFIHADETVQVKVAKIIAKYGDSKNQQLRDEIGNCYPSMLTTARQLLADFYDLAVQKDHVSEHSKQADNVKKPSVAPVAIVFPTSLDDLFFLCSQAFDHHEESWYIDLLPAALIYFQPLLKEADIQRFEPAFQRAFALRSGGYRPGQGYFDGMLTDFFIDYGCWLISNFPSGSQKIEQIFKFNNRSVIDSYSAHWDIHQLKRYTPYKALLILALKKIKNADALPLLSTPTFSPCWLSPETFITRLQAYQQAGIEPAEIDLQVAISRCYMYDHVEISEEAIQKLTGELQDLMRFLLINDAKPVQPVQYKAAWMVASLTRKDKREWPEFASLPYYTNSINNFTGNLYWESVIKDDNSDQYDFQTNKYVSVPIKRKTASVTWENKNPGSGPQKNLTDVENIDKNDSLMLYDHMGDLTPSAYVNNDIKRMLALIPNNPETILAYIFNKCLQRPEFSEVIDKKIVVAVLQFLHEIWQTPGEMAKLFLGTCMLSTDKTIVSMAGEIWLKAVSESSIHNADLGKIIGAHERIEFAPLKRFNDLVMQNLFQVSSLHNRELQILIEYILMQLPDQPIQHLKKLLEIYQELIIINQCNIKSPEVIDRLKTWEGSGGLKKISQALVNYIRE